MLQKEPDGFDFTIRTPGTPPRWVEMDQEMSHVWKLLTLEARRKGVCVNPCTIDETPLSCIYACRVTEMPH